MAADASIFSQYLRPVRSVAEYAADMDQADAAKLDLEGKRRQNALSSLQFEQTQAQVKQGIARQNALQRLASDPSMRDPVAREAAMLADPLLAGEGQALRKDRLEAGRIEAQTGQATASAGKSSAETEALRYKQRIEQANTALKDIAAFRDPASALSDLQIKVQEGHIKPEQAQVMAQQLQSLQTPQQWADWQRMTRYRILDAKDQLEQEWKAKEFDLSGQKFAEDRRRNLATEGLTARGQSLADARARESMAQSDRQFGQKMSAERGGNITEGERNAGGYASRMVEATKLLDQFEGAGRATLLTRAAGSIPLVGEQLRRSASNPDQQRYQQAQEDWVRSKLRKESGAAIGKDEMESEIRTYFPMPGDTPEVVAQKRQAREVANRAMVQAAGRGAPRQAADQAPAAARAGQSLPPSQVIDFGSLK